MILAGCGAEAYTLSPDPDPVLVSKCTRDLVSKFLLKTTPYVAGVHPSLLPSGFLHPSLNFDHSMDTYSVDNSKSAEMVEMLNNEV